MLRIPHSFEGSRLVRPLMAVALVGVILAAGTWMFWPTSTDPATSSDATATVGQSDADSQAQGSETPEADKKTIAMTDGDLRSQIVADWELNLDGVRRLTVRADGTATLDYRPNAAYSWILGERVQIEIEWKLTDGQGFFRSVRGKPDAAFQWISNFRGTENVWKIIELDERHALMWDEKDQSHYDWKRISPSTTDPSKQHKAAEDSPAIQVAPTS